MANIVSKTQIEEILSRTVFTEEEAAVINGMAAKKMSRDEVAAVYVLRKEGKSPREIAAYIGRDQRYIARILDKIYVSPLKDQLNKNITALAERKVSVIKEDLQEAAKENLAIAMSAITPQKVMDASIGDLSKFIKVNHDIYRLETGQSTQNIGVKGLIKTEGNDQQVAEAILKKMTEIETYFKGKGIDLNAAQG